MSNKNQCIQARCTECNQVVTIWQQALRRMVVKKDGKEYQIDYYQCPLCEVYFVIMVNDEQSLEVQKEYKSYVDRLVKHKKDGTQPSTTLVKRCKDAQIRFQSQTKKLGFEFPKTFHQFEELKLENIEKCTDAN